MNSFSIKSFGCRTNQAEAFQWAGRFQSQGILLEENSSKSDIVIINSCTITQRADADVRNFVRKISRRNPGARIIVTGCLAERDPLLFMNDPMVWKVFLNSEKDDLQREVIENFGKKKPVEYRLFRSRAPVKIQDGCDFKCTFCIIPQVRGKSRSESKESIAGRVRDLIQKGYKEIVLTGIHLCLYGKDLEPGSSLPELLSELVTIKDLKYIRLSSLDPRFLDKEFIDLIVFNEKICPHFHFSLQHTSGRIIEKMGRKISSERYSEVLEYTRERSPHASLGADIIVGFPGESEKDFDHLYAFLEKSPLSYFHVFSYSPRPGTAAARMKGIDSKTEKKRSALLRKLSRKKNLEFRKRFENTVLDGIVIKEKHKNLHVLTPNYLKVVVPDGWGRKSTLVRVKITSVKNQVNEGMIV
jgi:threonylcarbamoyladenosine tRNA methylthiotransferase MtaB